MIFVNGTIYATVWKVDKSEKYIDLSISTSEKDKDGAYTNSTWWPRAVGHAFNTLTKGDVSVGDFIRIDKCKLSNVSKKNEDGTYNKPYLNFIILDAEIVEKKADKDAKKNEPAPSSPTETASSNDESCPW